MKKNIVFFTGENETFLRKDVDRWIKVFTQKYGNFNIYKYNTENITEDIFVNIFSRSFFDDYKLIVINGFPLSGSVKDEKMSKIEEKFLHNIDNIPDEVFLLFVETSPDKRKAFYKKLDSVATLKKYDNLTNFDGKKYINENYNIDSRATEKLFDYCLGDFASIVKYLDKLELFKGEDEIITTQDIEENVTKDTSGNNIFGFIDAFFSGNKKLAMQALESIFEKEEYQVFIASLITNFRNIVYCQKLVDEGYKKTEILDNLGVKEYYLRLAENNKQKKDKIAKFLSGVIDVDNKLKRGEIIPDNGEEGIKNELFRII